MKKYFSFFFFALLAMFLVGCDSPNAYYPSGGGSDDDGGSNSKSYVTTGDAKDITYKSATLFGKVNVEISDYDEIEWGVMYSTDKAELESYLGTKVLAEGVLEEDVYSVSVTGLESETKYYYCAFVFLNEKQYKYGSVKSFTTLEAPGVDEITINTGSAEDISYNSAVLVCELYINFSDYSSVEYGVLYSTSRSDLQSNGTYVYSYESLENNMYSVVVNYLEPETKYYYCAFVRVNNKDLKLGSVKSFTTLEAPTGNGTLNGHEWVDLGLPSGLKWATCNVGASQPEEYGDYFAWGEVEPKEYYYWDSYKWCNGTENTQTKYCTNSDYGYNGFTDNKTTLELSDDAANYNWGGGWRMPTKEEQDDLRNNCSWEWTALNSVKGHVVTGPNGNSIFLPAAGFRRDSSLSDAGSFGFYWSSSLYTNYPYYAYNLRSSSRYVAWYYYSRSSGQSVRPVCQ